MGLFRNNKVDRVKVKICGLATEDDIIACSKIGVNAVGFLLGDSEGKSPSDKLKTEQAKSLIQKVPAGLSSVLLIQNNLFNEIVNLVDEISPNAIQIQSQIISSNTVNLLIDRFYEIEWIKTVKVQESDNLQTVLEKISPFINLVDAILLDSAKGGSGKTHDWSISREIALYLKSLNIPVILAGGLNSGNIVKAIDFVQPDMVDLMTGVSLEKGIKNIPEIIKVMDIVKNK